MKFILGTVGSQDSKYEDVAKTFDTVYEHFGKETIIDTGHRYMYKDDKNNAEVYIGRWIKERGLRPNEDVKVFNKVGLWYETNQDGERKIKSPELILEEMQNNLGFMPETVLIHALKDVKSISDERFLELAELIERTPSIKKSGFSAHMDFNTLLLWTDMLKKFPKQHYAMLPYSVLSDIASVEEKDGIRTVHQFKNPYGIEVWDNCTKEGFVAAKGNGFETIIMMPHEQGKIKLISHAPVWQNWCFRYACSNEAADYIAVSSTNITHLKEDIAIAEGEWYHPTNREGLRDKIVAESEELGNW